MHAATCSPCGPATPTLVLPNPCTQPHPPPPPESLLGCQQGCAAPPAACRGCIQVELSRTRRLGRGRRTSTSTSTSMAGRQCVDASRAGRARPVWAHLSRVRPCQERRRAAAGRCMCTMCTRAAPGACPALSPPRRRPTNERLLARTTGSASAALRGHAVPAAAHVALGVRPSATEVTRGAH